MTPDPDPHGRLRGELTQVFRHQTRRNLRSVMQYARYGLEHSDTCATPLLHSHLRLAFDLAVAELNRRTAQDRASADPSPPSTTTKPPGTGPAPGQPALPASPAPPGKPASKMQAHVTQRPVALACGPPAGSGQPSTAALIDNLIHTSDDPDAARRDFLIWFGLAKASLLHPHPQPETQP